VEKVTAPEFAGVIGGGSAAGGQFVYLMLRLGEADVPMLIEKSRVGALMAGLVTAAAMARKERVANDPQELAGKGLDAAYALKVSAVSVGRSSQPGVSILDVQIDAEQAGTMNLYLVADDAALRQLQAACATAMDETSKRPLRAN
jgi:hypothetical protein